MEPLLNLLQQLRSIEPDNNFTQHSRMVILNTPQVKPTLIKDTFVRAFQYGGGLALTGLLIVGILTGLSALNLKIFSPSLLTGLDTDTINKEFNDASLKLKLSEVTYYQDSFDKVAVILNETSKNGPGHINQNVIQKESDAIQQFESDKKDIDRLLNELVL